MHLREKITVLDFGSQYAHLIAKRLRSLGYYADITLPSVSLKNKTLLGVKGIILSGGPSSVYDHDTPEFNDEILSLNIPLLGLCYGHQLLCSKYGGTVGLAPTGEFGFARLEAVTAQNGSAIHCPLFTRTTLPAQVWMSHRDAVLELPPGFEAVAATGDCEYAAIQNLEKKRFGLQFHAEVKDTPCGTDIFTSFAEYCGMKRNWDQNQVLNTITDDCVQTAQNHKVLLFLSGGVDSTVAVALLNRALGHERVLGLHIDNGFMRQNESATIAERYRAAGLTNFLVEDASETFLAAVEGLTDPQQKRKAVGETFITVRNTVVKRLNLTDDEWLLGQGTLYPDIIESGGTKNARVIKTHHNRVDGIQSLIEQGLIIEPLKDLYKDEVRLLGKTLGLSDELVFRHPFPGPGLSINVLCHNGTVTDKQELVTAHKALEKVNTRVTLLLTDRGAPLCSLGVLPVKSVGVQGDFRTYRYPAVLRFTDILQNFPSWAALDEVSSFITNNVTAVNRTVLALYEPLPNTSGINLCQGYCTKDRLDQTRQIDAIVLEELKKSGWYTRIFQHLTINLPYATHTDRCSIVLRPVVSEDVMTARFAQPELELVNTLTKRIKESGFVDALYYDITNKPPATFGWE